MPSFMMDVLVIILHLFNDFYCFLIEPYPLISRLSLIFYIFRKIYFEMTIEHRIKPICGSGCNRLNEKKIYVCCFKFPQDYQDEKDHGYYIFKPHRDDRKIRRNILKFYKGGEQIRSSLQF